MKLCQHCEITYDCDDYSCPSCGWHPEVVSGIPVFAPELVKTNTGFNNALFEVLFRAETNHFWFRSRNKLIQSCLQKYFPHIGSYCEIGCGTGNVLSAVAADKPHITITGSEISLDALEFAARRIPTARLIQADICRFPFNSEFDLIGIFDVIEHIEDDEMALQNANQALKKNGGLILTVPQHKWLWSSFDQVSCHKRRYHRKELQSKIQNAGFEILYITSFMTLLLPFMVLSRLRKQNPARGVLSLSINGTVNSIFFRINMAEQLLFRKKVSLPTGGSLLCIARKIG